MKKLILLTILSLCFFGCASALFSIVPDYWDNPYHSLSWDKDSDYCEAYALANDNGTSLNYYYQFKYCMMEKGYERR
ncbi:MAG: hypothetical protein P9M02_02230 [Candidatus Susulua stagnicola]|nr:hypothetical protein [Candidatus Susulua stagnicola]